MIKGVNKNIIEISETGNDCFERAILFVRQDSKEKEKEHLYKRAGEYLSQMKIKPRIYRRQTIWIKVAKIVASGAIGAVITAFVLTQF